MCYWRSLQDPNLCISYLHTRSEMTQTQLSLSLSLSLCFCLSLCVCVSVFLLCLCFCLSLCVSARVAEASCGIAWWGCDAFDGPHIVVAPMGWSQPNRQRDTDGAPAREPAESSWSPGLLQCTTQATWRRWNNGVPGTIMIPIAINLETRFCRSSTAPAAPPGSPPPPPQLPGIVSAGAGVQTYCNLQKSSKRIACYLASSNCCCSWSFKLLLQHHGPQS
jgi:hypothetical protein